MGGILSAVGGLFAPKVKMPEVKTPNMPDPESPSLKLAAQRKIEARRKDGRAGTMLSQGPGVFSGRNLGGTA